MDLRDYLRHANVTAAEFRDRLEALGLDVSIGGLRKWITGERTPNVAKIATIEKATAGMVKAADWLEPRKEAPTKAAA